MSDKPIVLMANKSCKLCMGSGTFWENHGQGIRERMECDCAFQDVPEIFEIQNKIDNGFYVITPYTEGELK
jgi:hypothetical protein